MTCSTARVTDASGARPLGALSAEALRFAHGGCRRVHGRRHVGCRAEAVCVRAVRRDVRLDPRARTGPDDCRDFYFPYARKIWGLAPEALDPEQAKRRVAAARSAK
jgi:hypothetical protein